MMASIPPITYDWDSVIELERIPGKALPIDQLYIEDEGVLIDQPGLDITGTIDFISKIYDVRGFTEMLGEPLCNPEYESVVCYLNYDPATRSIIDHIDFCEIAVTGRTMRMELTEGERAALKPMLEKASREYNGRDLDDPAWFEPETEYDKAIAVEVKGFLGQMEFTDEIVDEGPTLVFHSFLEEIHAAAFTSYMFESGSLSPFIQVQLADDPGPIRHVNVHLDEDERDLLLTRMNGFCRERFGMDTAALAEDIAAQPGHGEDFFAIDASFVSEGDLKGGTGLDQIASDAVGACKLTRNQGDEKDDPVDPDR